MSHPIGALPLSLFNYDGSPRKTTDSDLVSYLDARAEVVSEADEKELPRESCIFAMARQFYMPHAGQTFDDLVQKYMKGVVSCVAVSDTVMYLTDMI